MCRCLQEKFDMFPEKRSLSKLSCLALLLGACTACFSAHANSPASQAGDVSTKSTADSLHPLGLSYSFKLAQNDDDCMEEANASDTSRKSFTTTSNGGKSMDGVMVAALTNTSKKSSVKDTSQVQKPAQQNADVNPVVDKPSPQVWEISPTDKTLNAALARWTAIAGWQLSWELPVDYSVEVKTDVPGTFEQAVELVTKSMDSAEIPMKAIFYNGNKVLRIVQKGTK